MAFLQELQLAANAGKKQRQQEVDTSSELRVINFRLDMTKELLFEWVREGMQRRRRGARGLPRSSR